MRFVGGFFEWLKGLDCKFDGIVFVGLNFVFFILGVVLVCVFCLLVGECVVVYGCVVLVLMVGFWG